MERWPVVAFMHMAKTIEGTSIRKSPQSTDKARNRKIAN